MTIAEMFGQSGSLALLGMGVVFGFLTLLVVCVTVAGKVIHALGLDKDVETTPAGVAAPGSNNSVVAAITAAVETYRKE
ncbi:MAG: OadG family protein [Spirochaetaceae bacterium]|jgi:oxaloacetate decarboxylase gamma subunit|nr:OadG family protein [Spirochaetaceae bacterium]